MGGGGFGLSSEELTLSFLYPWPQNDLSRGEGYHELDRIGQRWPGRWDPTWEMDPGVHCPLPPLSPAAYPSAYAPVSTAFPQQPSALPQQQREGEGQGAGDQSLVGAGLRVPPSEPACYCSCRPRRL